MKKYLYVFIVMMAIAVLAGCAQQNGATIKDRVYVTKPQASVQPQPVYVKPTTKAVQAVPAKKVPKWKSWDANDVKVVRISDKSKCPGAFAGKLCGMNNSWQPQVVLYNDTPQPSSDHEVWTYVRSINDPGRSPYNIYEPYGYRLYGCGAEAYSRKSIVASAPAQEPIKTLTIKKKKKAKKAIAKEPACKAEVDKALAEYIASQQKPTAPPKCKAEIDKALAEYKAKTTPPASAAPPPAAK